VWLLVVRLHTKLVNKFSLSGITIGELVTSFSKIVNKFSLSMIASGELVNKIYGYIKLIFI
jgi:hypothetical protein